MIKEALKYPNSGFEHDQDLRKCLDLSRLDDWLELLAPDAEIEGAEKRWSFLDTQS